MFCELNSPTRNSEKGFTLVEVLVAVAVLGALAGLSLPNLSGITQREAVTVAAEELANNLKSLQAKAIVNDQSNLPLPAPGSLRDQVVGYYLSVPNFSSPSYSLKRLIRVGAGATYRSETANQVILPADLPLETGSGTPLQIYFQTVSGRIGVARTGALGGEPPWLSGSVSLFVHKLNQAAPCQQVTIDASGKISLQDATACGSAATPSPSPTPSPTLAPSITPTPTPTQTPTPTLTPTRTPTPTFTPTLTPTRTPTPTLTLTPIPTPTVTPTPTPTSSNSSSFPANADSYVAVEWPNSNFSSATNLDVMAYLTFPRRTFIRFNLASIPVNASVSSATLSLSAQFFPTTARTYSVHRVTANWSESEIKWWNAPSFAETSTVSQTVGPGGSGQADFDVTADVRRFVTGSSTNYGWVIKDVDWVWGGPYLGRFYSREWSGTSQRPELRVTWSTP